ncbi:MAG: PAS domain S-box protein [Marinifilaceae bacterium]|nr:PAS domain S-box protein [Marinifilaceae bacterium]
MKRWISVLLFFILLLPFGISAQENKHVLLISSYNSRFPTYSQQINGIKSVLDTADVNIDVEFMDSKRFTDPETYDLFYKSLKNKLANSIKYNAILIADDNAFKFALQYEDELFKNIPIVFLGVNNIEKALQQNANPNVKGVVESVSMKETIELMISLFPEAGSIYCISDSTSTGQAHFKQYRQISSQISGAELKEIDLSQLTFSEYKAKLQTIPINAPVLLLSAHHDKLYNSIDFDHVINLLHENLHAPLFHLWEHGMGEGVLGGKMISHFEQGKIAAEMVYKILSGESLSNIKLVNESPNVFMFDYNQLLKYEVALNKLPHNSIIINQPITFWKKHKQPLLISLTIIVALLVLVLLLSRNIINRKKIEKQLKIQNSDILKLNSDLLNAKLRAEEEEQKFTQLFYNHTAVKLIVCAETGQVFDANPAAAAFYGWSLEKLCQMNISDINTLSFSEIENEMKMAKKNGKVHFEFKHRKADGSVTDVEVFSSRVNILGKHYLYSIIHDLSEKKNHEHRINLLSRSVEQSPVAIVITNREGIIEYVNPAFTEITGYLYNEAIGQNPRILKSEKTSNKLYKELWNTICSGKTWQGEIQNKKANGEFYWMKKAISPIYVNNELTNFVSVSEDITEKRKIIEDLVVAKEKAQESDRLKSAFLANMSHEIRTPMNGILGFVNLLNEPNLSKSKIDEYSTIINQSGERLLNTISDIIDISKIEAGEMLMSNTETSINKVMEELYSFFSPEANKKGLSLILEPSHSNGQLSVMIDSNKLHGILTNLIKNAIKYTEKGTIIFGYSLKDELIKFFIKDTGIGIPKDRLHAIFNRFEQADVADKMALEGSGLGLAISKAYAKMLGGDIFVESIEDKGSIFTFTLPINKKVKKQTEKVFENFADETRMENLSLLVVEDDNISSLLLKSTLSRLFKEIIFVDNGKDAIETCRNNKEIDLVLMDIKMPIMNGYDATTEIRKFNKDLLIIAQTAYALRGDKEKAMLAGCNNYILKPIKIDELRQMITKYAKQG